MNISNFLASLLLGCFVSYSHTMDNNAQAGQLNNAIQNRTVNDVQIALVQGADANEPFSSTTPLFACTSPGVKQAAEKAELLLDAGADPDLPSPYFCPLHAAVTQDQPDSDLITTLLERGADPAKRVLPYSRCDTDNTNPFDELNVIDLAIRKGHCALAVDIIKRMRNLDLE